MRLGDEFDLYASSLEKIEDCSLHTSDYRDLSFPQSICFGLNHREKRCYHFNL